MSGQTLDAVDNDGTEVSGNYAALFAGQFGAMTRLATLLGADDPEDVAQEAFVRLHRRSGTLRDPHASLAYLRTTVVNLSRSRLRHLQVVRRHNEAPPADVDSAEIHAVHREDARELVTALSHLSARHREALVLRYWLDLSEAEMSDAMGVSRAPSSPMCRGRWTPSASCWRAADDRARDPTARRAQCRRSGRSHLPRRLAAQPAAA